MAIHQQLYMLVHENQMLTLGKFQILLKGHSNHCRNIIDKAENSIVVYTLLPKKIFCSTQALPRRRICNDVVVELICSSMIKL